MRRKYIFLLLLCFFVASCSTKKNSFKNRFYHKSTAWFNTLFNGEETLNETLTSLKEGYEENYSEILPVEPLPKIDTAQEKGIDPETGFNPLKRSSFDFAVEETEGQTSTGFDRVEEKSLKAIDRHSMLIKGVEYNKMMTRAYLDLGKSNYYRGKSLDALDAFEYIESGLPFSKKFTPEAKLYKGLATIQMGNRFEGMSILEEMYNDDELKKYQKRDVAKAYAQNLIEEEKYEEAIEALHKNIKITKNKKEKARYHYILGQIYSDMGEQEEAGKAFDRVFKMKPGFNLEVKSKLAIAANFDPERNIYESYKSHLLSIAKKGNYVSRQNEFHYAIADMAYKKGDTKEAISYLKKSLEQEQSDPYIRGRVYELFGNIEFQKGNYVFASAYYDSAVNVIPYDKDIERINSVNDNLKTLMEKHYLVQKNDSILKLAYMPKEEQNKHFSDYIEKLKVKDAEKQKEEEQQLTVFQTQTKGSSFNTSFSEDKKGSFYFYNASLKDRGLDEFRRVWGDIKLGDNWRNSMAGIVSVAEKEAELTGTNIQQNPRRYDLDFYIEQIPTSVEELTQIKIERDTAELSLGIGYHELLENDTLAIKTLEHLVSTPPKEKETEMQAYYQLYRISGITNNPKKEDFKNHILSKYPNSMYAEFILNPDSDFTTPTTKEALAYYEETYDLYKDKKYEEVKQRTLEAMEKYQTEVIMAKFSLLNALAIGATESEENYRNALGVITVAYQNSEEAKRALKLLELLDKEEAINDDSEKDENHENEEGYEEVSDEFDFLIDRS